MKIIVAWQIWEWDGGERQNPTDKFLATEELAVEYKKARPSDYASHKVLVIVDSMAELKEVEHAVVRKAALAKLTPLERKVLNLEK